METQESVSTWAEQTFGPAGSNFRVVARVNEEMAELLRALSAHDESKVIEEAADVIIVAYRVGFRIGIDLDSLMPQRAECQKLSLEHPALRHFINDANRAMCNMIGALMHNDEPHVESAGEFSMFRWWMSLLVRNMAYTCESLGHDLRQAIADKMAVNRERQWKVDGTGHGYHVREKSEGAHVGE